MQETRNARRRLEALFDSGSFIELDEQVSHRSTNFGMEKRLFPGDGVTGGFGRIQGQTVYAYAQDEQVMGGSLGEAHAGKICKLMEMAASTGAPIVALSASGGARIQEGVDALSGYGRIFRLNTRLSGKVLQIACILGSCAGGAAYSSALADFVIMARDKGRMFITGPDVAKAVMGEDVSPDALGGAAVHLEKSGCAHFAGQNEAACFRIIRSLLDFYRTRTPASFRLPTKEKCDPAKWRALIPADPRQPYDMRAVIRQIADAGEFLEVMPEFAPNMLIGFLRIGGRTVGVTANQPSRLAGCLDIDAADKAARFIRTCDAHGIPLFSCVDVPGFIPGTRQEHGGIIRHGAKMLYAWSEACVPRVTLVLRKAYGGAYIAMDSRELGANLVFAWPEAEIAVMGADSAASILFRREPPEQRLEKTQAYKRLFSGPLQAEKRGYVDAVIQPESTRYMLLRAFELLAHNQQTAWHGNIPL